MPAPFTDQQIDAMNATVLDERLTVALGWGEVGHSSDTYLAAPLPWYIDPWPNLPRKRLKKLLGDEPRSPYVICRPDLVASVDGEEIDETFTVVLAYDLVGLTKPASITGESIEDDDCEEASRALLKHINDTGWTPPTD